jgi:hypothetical protein
MRQILEAAKIPLKEGSEKKAEVVRVEFRIERGENGPVIIWAALCSGEHDKRII